MGGYQPGNLCFLLCIAWMKVEKGSYLFAKNHPHRCLNAAYCAWMFRLFVIGLGFAEMLSISELACSYGIFRCLKALWK